ncbi:unannotated protein [freshwater metagenome]|uniref:Unannotated protein n=1 Tax=freshwater metagenome TaxID=449393 RepID=A0A6J7DK18_9ZZZZ|nr:hypothetical protein [Actinomycetota bacterium]MSV64372.1 hypothetical protein [Actinomycetota bacterium]MSW26416.1 hypothetical protein [Actinomycetota bacterium]MSW34567.1 hypothetical protein [Actinomycetota bacterium]MSX31257.1 hypothetical protein [Actinomycetota bacterium]
MQSLALLVGILFLSSLGCGPIAYWLTTIHPRTHRRDMYKKALIAVLTMWGSMTGINFALAHVPIYVRFIGVFSIATSLLAVKKEFGGPRKLKEE